MNNKNYSIVKLSNGENIICNVINNSDNSIEIESPLKLETHGKLTSKGIAESLSLVRWMQPFCDYDKFTINKNTVIINVPVSIGLGKYYEFILKKLNGLDIIGPSDEELKEIEMEQKKEQRRKQQELLELESGEITIH